MTAVMLMRDHHWEEANQSMNFWFGPHALAPLHATLGREFNEKKNLYRALVTNVNEVKCGIACYTHDLYLEYLGEDWDGTLM